MGPRQMGSMGMLAALSICLAVEDTTGLKPSIKWPNDLMLNGRKLAGILCEADWRGETLRHLVLGFGLNVNIERFPNSLAGTAISLSQALGRKVVRTELMAAILERLEQGYFQILTDGFASFLPRVQVRDFLKGRRVLVEYDNGERLDGTARGIDEHGALLVEQKDDGRPVTIVNGHVLQF
jgi:BirA family biotin operon repressor/biotin-[acetyl-CoA-carboxylase] ligase